MTAPVESTPDGGAGETNRLVAIGAIFRCINNGGHAVSARYVGGFLDRATCYSCGHGYDRYWSPKERGAVALSSSPVQVDGELDEAAIRADERRRLSELLATHAGTIDGFAPSRAAELIAFLLTFGMSS